MKFKNRLRILAVPALAVVLALVAVVLAVTGSSAHALGVDNSLPPVADLSISAVARDSSSTSWIVAVKALPVGRHPLARARDVKVQFSVETLDPSPQISSPTKPLNVTMEHLSYGNYDENTMIWTIPELPPADFSNVPPEGGIARAAEAVVRPPRISPPGEPAVLSINAEIIGAEPAEPAGFDDNNAVGIPAASEGTGTVNHTNGDTGASVSDISDRFPNAGATTTFTVRVENYSWPIAQVTATNTHDVQLGVQVKIDLSQGLTFANAPLAPDGTTFSETNETTGVWNVGTLDAGESNAKMLPVAVNLVSESLRDLPLEKRCLTAEVISAVPWFEFDLRKRENDIDTLCLGKATEVELRQHDVALFHLLDCVGRTARPCTNDDSMELLVSRRGHDRIGNATWWREITRDRASIAPSEGYLRPEQVTVHVPDPIGRHDGKWRTGSTEIHTVGDTQGVGVVIQYVTGSAWTQFTEEISDVSPKQRPSSLAFIGGNTANWNQLNADTKPSDGPFSLSATTRAKPYPVYLEFGTLGTYKMRLTFGATKSGTAYTASGIYTFHVGPMADLAVRDAGANPAVAGDRQAYTVMAVNNGPDAAPQVQITGLPAGVPEYVASQGQYDRARGVWTIDNLESPGYGPTAEGPTLTLFTDDFPGTEITAAIETTQEYCVRIKTGETDPVNDLECSGPLPTGYTQHSAAYYDHVERNNSATIVARTGVLPRQGHPDAPVLLTTVETLIGNLIWWQPVERVHGHPVTHYELQRLDLSVGRWTTAAEVTGTMYLDEAASPDFPAYRVRAVNWMGVGGPWSRPEPDTGLDLPGEAPTVVGAGIASAPGAGDTYQLGETITLEVTFSEPVRVQGTPTLALRIGDAVRLVPMATHHGDKMFFRYVVAAGDTDSDGVSVPRNGLSLSQGASIASLPGKVAVLGLPGFNNQAAHKVNAPGGAPEPALPYYIEAPEAPSALTATPSDGSVQLQWGPYCCDQKDVFYQIWRGDFPTWLDIAGSDRNTSEHTVSGLTNGDTYRFQVRAVYRHRADDGTITEYPGTPSRTVVATPSSPQPNAPANRPPVFERSADEDFSVVERSLRGTYVATVRATDPDGDRLTYTLAGENANKFSVSNINGAGEIRVAEDELGYTWEPGGVSFSIGVEVTDDRGGRDSRVVGVQVAASKERNEAPVAEDPGTLTVACGASLGTAVGTITANDPENDSLWYILVGSTDGEFQFRGGGTNHPDPIWENDNALLVSDGSGAVLEVAKDLSGDDICGKLITVVLEIEEAGNPANNDTLVFQVRVENPTASRSTTSGEDGSVLATVRTWMGNVRNWWAGFRSWPDWGSRALAARP